MNVFKHLVTCPVCTGDGELQFEKPRRQNFNRDVGEIDMITEICYECWGKGEVEMDDCDPDLDSEE